MSWTEYCHLRLFPGIGSQDAQPRNFSFIIFSLSICSISCYTRQSKRWDLRKKKKVLRSQRKWDMSIVTDGGDGRSPGYKTKVIKTRCNCQWAQRRLWCMQLWMSSDCWFVIWCCLCVRVCVRTLTCRVGSADGGWVGDICQKLCQKKCNCLKKKKKGRRKKKESGRGEDLGTKWPFRLRCCWALQILNWWNFKNCISRWIAPLIFLQCITKLDVLDLLHLCRLAQNKVNGSMSPQRRHYDSKLALKTFWSECSSVPQYFSTTWLEWSCRTEWH